MKMKHYAIKFPLLFSFLLLGCANQNQSAEQEKEYTNTETENVLPKEQKESLENVKLMPIESEPKKKENKKPAGNAEKTQAMKQKVILDVPLVRQNPELKYGCEVTSLSMVLQYAGVKVDKIKLANQLDKDMDPVIKDKNGNILKWGNPDDGFVGDITGKHMGYAVFDKPMERLMTKYLPNRTINLTNKPFDQILAQVNKGKPVLVWTTGDYRLPDRWESWKHGNQTIKTPLDLHAVVLVGYDKDYVYLNDPLSGRKNVQVKKTTFIQSWEALKKRALSYN
jgi:uncharacterized protein YvpB